jgi:nucleoside-diphosphate-sugar epimerase
MKRVLVTGATGFVGGELCALLAAKGYLVRAVVRPGKRGPVSAAESVTVDEIGPDTDFAAALKGVDVVYHLAAIAHILNPTPANLGRYHVVNALGTRQLVEQAAKSGVKRFVYLSSVKVNGEATHERPFNEGDTPNPSDEYGKSKLAGEQYVLAVGQQGPMETVVVRPPLVYGPGVRANFLRLIWLADRGWPLPLGSVSNARSLVSIWNLTDFLATLAEHPSAAGRVWMVSDGEDLSTPELLTAMGSALKRRIGLVPFPIPALRAIAGALGKGGEFSRLCGSLVVDISSTRRMLGWSPPLTVKESIARTAAWYRSERGNRGT